jgi:hypothetical protein
VPKVRLAGWASNPIDAFILARLEAEGLSPSPPADRLRLLRRVTYDLTGLPPTPEEQEAFLGDPSPDAYLRVVDRLLASPAFGERQAQDWLDLVRYAESDGFKEDALRPNTYRYRDWVIRAFNGDLPYDRFVSLQLAGDELAPDDPDALIATGYHRLYPDESNAANLEQRRQEILDEITDTTGLVFLGLTVGCARCHDHKYDPISQKDYYRFQSFFAPFRARDLVVLSSAERRAYEAKVAEWEAATHETRAEMERLISPLRERLRQDTVLRFRAEIQEAVRTPHRTPYQQIIALMAEIQMDRGGENALTRLPAAQKKRYQELLSRLPPRPTAPLAHAITDVGAEAPPTHRLLGGDWRRPAATVEPQFLTSLGGGKPDLPVPSAGHSTGRRTALAHWLTDERNPLTARVLVNRLWQHHFGAGIVTTASDFGVQGSGASHPELLDWLARELIDSGWSLKHLHRLMVASSAYRQDSAVHPADPEYRRARSCDPENRLLRHARRRRLDGEVIRDAILSLSGGLERRMFGPSSKPELPEGLSRYAWKPDDRPEERQRRSIYVLVRRNLRFPLFDAFDLPDLHNSCSRRAHTTTASQALLLLNGQLTHDQARAWAGSLRNRFGEDTERLVAHAYQAVWGRHARPNEVKLALAFLARQVERHHDPAQALTDFCHALFNTSEFLTID